MFKMFRRVRLGSITALAIGAMLLVACGGELATAIPGAPTIEPTTAAGIATTVSGAADTAVAAGNTAVSGAGTVISEAATALPTTVAGAATSIAGALGSGPIPIGIGVAQTGAVALLGQEEVTGAQVAEKFFNDKGGVNGTQIKLIFQDTAGDEAGAINAFQSLINQGNVVGIVGPTLSQQAFSADPIADRAHVPVLGPSNTAKGIPQIGDYIARVSAPVAVVAPNAIDAALGINPNIKNVVVLYAQDDAFSKSETGTFQDTVKAKGLNLTQVLTFSTKDTDFQKQATDTISQKPDLVIVSGLAQDGGNLVKQLRDLGYKGLIIGGNGLNTANVFKVCQAQCDGLIIAEAYSPEANTDMNSQFKEAMKAKQGDKPPSQFNAQAFTGVQVFVEALKSLDNKSKISGMSLADLRTALNKEILAGKYDTPLGSISFTPEGEINQAKFYVAQIKMNPDGTTGTFTYIK